MNKMLETNRLVIKPYQDTDQSAMIELLTNSKIKETFMIPDFQTEEDAVRMFKKLQAFSYSEDHYERGIYLENQLIGFVNDVEISEVVIELGYVIHPEYHNRGYASEMLKAVIDELFRKGFHQIVSGAFVNNAASIQVMQKCGMKKIAKEEDISYQGVLHHCYYYAIAQT
ncbi:GNAT family N-acetyltransferase [Anaeromicropila herbilytica]|uniref:Putative N-acetyltransferase YnaD n=1 Tax=Anaeromicropila herbilytica TaxID=2785025 RepID=A0A7R7EL35_9FIRM|nr:GNAT family N-acetyltransferase [Anaeromicropila herbilytica]BCN30825.1 putative N-acetyltransferase YnaD [Anaeromicropila herbilytica]